MRRRQDGPARRVSGYRERTAIVTHGLSDGDTVVLAGVHTVYAGQHVKQAKPLFDGDADE